ncbi:hypothetical protein ACHQM5_011244 [Ranunculus cassubicifolius]
MEDTGGSCSSSSNLNSVKPVVVRVKRKSSQSPVEAFWLEINERPQKRAMLDFEKLSISDLHEKVSENKNKKVFVQHVETVTNSDAAIDIVQSFVSNSTETKSEERKRSFKDVNKHHQLLSRSKQSHEFLAKNARFEQIWRSRKGKKESKDGDIHQVCNLYDVVRVDSDEKSSKKEKPRDTSMEDDSILRDYLPLLRECLPSAAEEIESDMLSYFSNQGGSADDFVYDLYTVQDEPQAAFEDSVNAYPLVQVDEEDDFYDGPTQSEFESDDSNAEDNPLNDYPDEEETSEDEDSSEEDKDVDEDEDEDESGSSDKESVIVEDYKHYDVDDEDFFYEEDDSDDEEYEWTENA